MTQFTPQPPPVPPAFSDNAPPALPRVGIGKRGLAAAIDHFLLYILIAALITFTAGLWTPLLEPVSDLLEKSINADYTELSSESKGWLMLFRLIYYIILAGSTVFCLYFVPEILWGTTPGKRLLKIRIVSVSGTTTFNQLLIRWLAKFSVILLQILALIVMVQFIRSDAVSSVDLPGLSFLLSLGNIFSFIYIAGCCTIFGQNKQTFYDMIAKTVVVQEQ